MRKNGLIRDPTACAMVQLLTTIVLNNLGPNVTLSQVRCRYRALLT